MHYVDYIRYTPCDFDVRLNQCRVTTLELSIDRVVRVVVSFLPEEFGFTLSRFEDITCAIMFRYIGIMLLRSTFSFTWAPEEFEVCNN